MDELYHLLVDDDFRSGCLSLPLLRLFAFHLPLMPILERPILTPGINADSEVYSFSSLVGRGRFESKPIVAWQTI